MSEKQFTPGPWVEEAAHVSNDQLDKDETYRRIMAGEGDYDIDIPNSGFCLMGYIAESNAKMLAAAPEMYELLEYFLMNEYCGDHADEVRSLLKRINNEK